MDLVQDLSVAALVAALLALVAALLDLVALVAQQVVDLESLLLLGAEDHPLELPQAHLGLRVLSVAAELERMATYSGGRAMPPVFAPSSVTGASPFGTL